MPYAVDWVRVEHEIEMLSRRFTPSSLVGQRLMVIFAALQACREELPEDSFSVPLTWWRITTADGSRHAIGARHKVGVDKEVVIIGDGRGNGQVVMPAGTFTVIDEPITEAQCEQWVTIGAVEPSLVPHEATAEEMVLTLFVALKPFVQTWKDYVAASATPDEVAFFYWLEGEGDQRRTALAAHFQVCAELLDTLESAAQS